MAQRRAVTLLELLIAIGLLVALAAIVAPSLMAQLDERRFDSTIDLIAQQLTLARAHAQATGEPVEVRWVMDEQAASMSVGDDANAFNAKGSAWRLEARLLKIELPDAVLTESAVHAQPTGSGEQSDATIYEAWALQQLPAGYEIVDEQPQWLREATANDGAFGDAASETQREPLSTDDGLPMRLAVFLPDGSALLGETRWLVDDAQRAAKIDVNGWTGLPTVERVEPHEDALASDEDEDAEAEPDDDVHDDERSVDDESSQQGERTQPRAASSNDDGGTREDEQSR